jgi:hypothetical protein
MKMVSLVWKIRTREERREEKIALFGEEFQELRSQIIKLP